MKIAKSHVIDNAPTDVKFNIEAPETITRGENIDVKLMMENNSDKELQVDVSLTSQIVRYTGVALKKLKVRNDRQKLEPKKCKYYLFLDLMWNFSG